MTMIVREKPISARQFLTGRKRIVIPDVTVYDPGAIPGLGMQRYRIDKPPASDRMMSANVTTISGDLSATAFTRGFDDSAWH